MGFAPLDHVLDSMKDLFPRGIKGAGNLLPGQFSGPAREKQHVGFGEFFLAITPWNLFNLYAARLAFHSTHSVKRRKP